MTTEEMYEKFGIKKDVIVLEKLFWEKSKTGLLKLMKWRKLIS